MRFTNREYRTLSRAREERLLAEVTFRVYGFPETFSEKDLEMDIDPNFHVIHQDNRVSYSCDGLHLLDIDLVRETGTQALLVKYSVYMELNRV